MHIKKIIIDNFRSFKKFELNLNSHLNILVGDNEVGKSTLLEAINLCLSGQINGRSVFNELNPYLFNLDISNEYIKDLNKGKKLYPPKISVELYLSEDPNLIKLKGTNNSLRLDCPGILLSIEFDEDFSAGYEQYISEPENVRFIPVEYYKIVWRSFSSENLIARNIPIKPTYIDASNIKHNAGANKYILEIMKDYLSTEEKAKLSLSYRKIKDSFSIDSSIVKINQSLSSEKHMITSRNLSIALDNSSKASWENGIETHLDNIPLIHAGKGEQNSIKIKLAMQTATESNVFLIEEPENHLSHSNLNTLISNISSNSIEKQLIITTHSSFVLNKLGVENVILFGLNKGVTLNDLSEDTKDYFLKLPGHNTLRLILSKKTILVEGPSDELMVQKAFYLKYGVIPLEQGVDVITVNSLAFKRFLEIAMLLNIKVAVVTDNDGNLGAIKKKYIDYEKCDNIKIFYDEDITAKTLEPQLLKSNDLKILNHIFKKEYKTDTELLDFMKENKTFVALSLFNTKEDFNIPDYIQRAINE